MQEAYELGQTIYSDSDPLFGPIAYHFGAVQIALKDRSALVALTQAKNNYEQHLGKNSLQLIPVLSDLGSAHILAGNSKESQNYVTRAVKLAAEEYGKNSTIVADLSSRSGQGFSEFGDYSLAIKLQKVAYEIYQSVLGPTSIKTGKAAYNLSESFRLDQNLRGQVTFLKKTVNTFDQPLKSTSDFEYTIHRKLVEAYHALDKPKRATKHVLALASSSENKDLAGPTLLVKVNTINRGRGEQKNIGGFVTLKFDVDSEGFVRNIDLLELEGERKLVKFAIDALNAYRYIPTVLDKKTEESKGMETKIISSRMPKYTLLSNKEQPLLYLIILYHLHLAFEPSC